MVPPHTPRGEHEYGTQCSPDKACKTRQAPRREVKHADLLDSRRFLCSATCVATAVQAAPDKRGATAAAASRRAASPGTRLRRGAVAGAATSTGAAVPTRALAGLGSQSATGPATQVPRAVLALPKLGWGLRRGAAKNRCGRGSAALALRRLWEPPWRALFGPCLAAFRSLSLCPRAERGRERRHPCPCPLGWSLGGAQ